MENLVDRKIYDSDDSGYWRRLPWVMGIAFGLFTVVACFIAYSLTLPREEMAFGILMSLAMGFLAGAMFGWRFPRKFRLKVSALTNALYAGKRDLIDEPPVERGLRYRLPCSRIKGTAFAVGGILYIGKDGLLFYPHRKNLKRDLEPIEIGPIGEIRLSLLPPPAQGLIRRILIPKPISLLEVRTAMRNESFSIPQPQRVIDILKKRIEEQTIEGGVNP